MMLGLFDRRPYQARQRQRKATRRNNVQVTSVLSAREERKRLDKREINAAMWLSNYVKETGALPTSLELSKFARRPVLEIRIGLSDAKRHGLVENGEPRKCSVSSKKSLVWRLSQR